MNKRWNYFKIGSRPKYWMLQWDWDHHGIELTEQVSAMAEKYV